MLLRLVLFILCKDWLPYVFILKIGSPQEAIGKDLMNFIILVVEGGGVWKKNGKVVLQKN